MWDVKPGDKVSVNKNWVPPVQKNVAQPLTIRLTHGVVYTVREVAECWSGPVLGFTPGIRLVEAVNEEQYLCPTPDEPPVWMEPFYVLAAFVKVVDSKGMETLRACLDPNKKIDGREIEKTLGLVRKLNKRFRNKKEETK